MEFAQNYVKVVLQFFLPHKMRFSIKPKLLLTNY